MMKQVQTTNVRRLLVGRHTFLHRHVSHEHQFPVALRQSHAEAAETRGEGETGDSGLF